MVQIGKKASTHTLIALLIAPLVGCGSSGSTAITTGNTVGPSGKSVQGAISGATIWGDSLSSGSKFVIDSTEQDTQTTTNSTGAYTLPKTPAYKYVIVSQGGTDTLTGRGATTMIAPGGSKTISGLTTLVALDTSGQLASILSALLPNGASFDTDFTTVGGLSPAAMVFITSMTTAITSFDVAIQDAATKAGATLSAQQLNSINLSLYSQMAIQFSTLSTATLSNTQGLSINLQTALNNAVTAISASSTNLAGLVPGTVASTIANNSVATAANVVGNAIGNAALKSVTASNVETTSIPISVSGTVTESAVIAGSNLQTVVSNITNTANLISSSITVTSTPTTYIPPTIAVINNPTVAGYNIIISADGSSYLVKGFTISFSDDMVATTSGGTNYAHSVLNPSNYTFTQGSCTPSSYSTNTVAFKCDTMKPGTFGVTIAKGSSTGGVWANSTSLGLIVDNQKSFTLPVITGSTGGTYSLF